MMSLYQRIVVGTDGSDGALAAVERAGQLAKVMAAGSGSAVEVHVVCSYHPMVGWQMGDFAGELSAGQEGLEMAERAAASNLEAASERLRGLGIDDDQVLIREHAAIGAPFDVLISVAENVDADLLVVGTRGLGAGKRLLLGSVSTKVVHHATCSVLVVHE